ncbi:MAG: hypothetical protein ACRC9X_09255 [Bacteroidales bacterium]
MMTALQQTILQFRQKIFFQRLSENEVSPVYVLLLFTLTVSVFLTLSYFLSSLEFKVFSRYTVTMPHVDELLGITYNDEHIISVDCSERGFFLSDPLQNEEVQSALPTPCTTDDIRDLPIQPFEYPQDNYHIFSPLMEQLQQLSGSRKLFRVVHYGDSQLEADRMSLYLRQSLQKQFGGGGIGYIALNPHIPINPTVRLSMSDNWHHSTAAVKHKRTELIQTGHMLSSASVAPSPNKSTWIKIARRQLRTYPPLRFSLVKMQIKASSKPVTIKVSSPTQHLYEETIMPNSDLQQIEINIGNNAENLHISFSGGVFTLYGLALDYASGIAVDNVPLRSSSGVDFKKISSKSLKQSLELSKARFLILQFGTNVVPRVVNNYSYYEEQLYQQLMHLKELQPHLSILVVGVADMARRVNGKMASYPNIERIRDAQKQAAFRANCAFWDSYKAMGGRNAIISWAYARPSLASKDFCHFSGDGATLMAELLHRSLMQEYYWYLAEQEDAKNASVSHQQY